MGWFGKKSDEELKAELTRFRSEREELSKKVAERSQQRTAREDLERSVREEKKRVADLRFKNSAIGELTQTARNIGLRSLEGVDAAVTSKGAKVGGEVVRNAASAVGNAIKNYGQNIQKIDPWTGRPYEAKKKKDSLKKKPVDKRELNWLFG